MIGVEPGFAGIGVAGDLTDVLTGEDVLSASHVGIERRVLLSSSLVSVVLAVDDDVVSGRTVAERCLRRRT